MRWLNQKNEMRWSHHTESIKRWAQMTYLTSMSSHVYGRERYPHLHFEVLPPGKWEPM